MFEHGCKGLCPPAFGRRGKALGSHTIIKKIMKSSLPTHFTWWEIHLANVLTSCSGPPPDKTWITCIPRTEELELCFVQGAGLHEWQTWFYITLASLPPTKGTAGLKLKPSLLRTWSFSLVPRLCVQGFMELMSSCYTGGDFSSCALPHAHHQQGGLIWNCWYPVGQ